MPFAALGEDILLAILSSCDVCTVLSVSAVCISAALSYLHLRVDNRQVTAPSFRDILELPPLNRAELETMSTIELVKLIKRIVDGPSCPPGELVPRIAFHAGTDLDLQVQAPCLLPGARYAVFHTRRDFRIYDVTVGLCIWQHPGKTFTAWSVDFVPGKAIALDGDFKLILVNWREKTCVVVKYDTHKHSGYLHVSPHATLFPGSIVVAYAEIGSPHQLVLTVRDIDSFGGRWKPLTGISLKDQISPQDVPFVAFSRPEPARWITAPTGSASPQPPCRSSSRASSRSWLEWGILYPRPDGVQRNQGSYAN
ncbi:hypothetical protein C8R47DRAFT_1323665 [Mycena vitilis]|nr:hypothetical protein C8R47DRAFT_1323665 [Mycena vitilis]